MRQIKCIGIAGAGTMGAALAQKFSQEGMDVILLDREEKFLERGLGHIKTTLAEGVERRIFTPEMVEQILSRIKTTIDVNDLAACQIVIEAVFEDKQVKAELFKKISDAVSADTILATNTSSFSVTELSQAVSNPERFLGIHFFYHAAKNRLVEIIRGDATSDDVFKDTFWLMQRCGKDPITCKDAHGFVVNRYFVPWLNEGVRILEEGLADIGTIDAIACKTYGCGMGPFALMNATGVPIAYHSQKTLEAVFGKFYAPAEMLKAQTEKNEEWAINEAGEIDKDLFAKISERMMAVTLYVCGQILDEEVCSAGDINRGAGVGLKWRKGPLELYHRAGEEKVRQMVGELAKKWEVEVPKNLDASYWQPDYIAVEKNGSVGTITINRPEGMNAINEAVVEQLSTAFDQLESDASINTIMITGRGKAFVAGADIKFFIDNIRKDSIDDIYNFTSAGQKLYKKIDESSKKVIAVVNGLALGGGLELALAADLIVALDRAILAFPETGIGIYPGLGGTQRPIGRIGKGLTKYLVYTGQMLSAKKAQEIGLVDKVVGWDELRELMLDPSSLERSTAQPGESWATIGKFFDENNIGQLLSDKDFGEDWAKVVKKVRYKAPCALKLAESLIDEEKGPESELEHIKEIFKTEDALAGLMCVGKKPPQFKGC